jgi:hypothetical protein
MLGGCGGGGYEVRSVRGAGRRGEWERRGVKQKIRSSVVQGGASRDRSRGRGRSVSRSRDGAVPPRGWAWWILAYCWTLELRHSSVLMMPSPTARRQLPTCTGLIQQGSTSPRYHFRGCPPTLPLKHLIVQQPDVIGPVEAAVIHCSQARHSWDIVGTGEAVACVGSPAESLGLGDVCTYLGT